jgi:hypothetical protein
MGKYRYISRIENEKKHTFGWYVRVKVGDAMYQKLFSDKTYGGKRQALSAALDYRDELEKRKALVKPTPKYRIGYPFGGRINSNTGISGISESFLRVRKRSHHVIQVSWRENLTQPRNKKFYISKIGSRETALMQAIEFRMAREKEMLEAYHARLEGIAEQLRHHKPEENE